MEEVPFQGRLIGFKLDVQRMGQKVGQRPKAKRGVVFFFFFLSFFFSPPPCPNQIK